MMINKLTCIVYPPRTAILLGCLIIILLMGCGCIPPIPPTAPPGIIIVGIPPLFIPSGPVGPLAILGPPLGPILRRFGFELMGMPGRTPMGCPVTIPPIELVVTPFIEELLGIPPEATTTWGPPMEPTTEVGADEDIIPRPPGADEVGKPPPSPVSNRRSSGNALLSESR